MECSSPSGDSQFIIQKLRHILCESVRVREDKHKEQFRVFLEDVRYA